MDMNVKNEKTKEQEEILALARNTEYYCDLLIKQCDNWLPEKEGLKHLGESNNNKRTRKKWFFL